MRLLRLLLWLLPLLVRLAGDAPASTTASAAHTAPATEPAREWTMCIPDLGCLNTTEEWYHPAFRPHNPLPSKRHTIKTSFVLYRRQGAEGGAQFASSVAGVAASGFNRSLGTTILIHDYTSSGSTGWVKHLSDALLARGERNVVAVDWESGALPPYAQAAANSRVVALEVAALLRRLASNFSVDARSVHLVGHGLGAHVAGYVGEAVHGVARITGLDPSGPLFEGMGPLVRLDPGDADFVDVIHTDVSTRKGPDASDGQGIAEPSGHVDFYPNGGRDQPGCSHEKVSLMKMTRDSLPAGSILPDCSHKRAFKYFTESVSAAGCDFVAFECADRQSFLDGNCSSCGPRGAKCALMGYSAPKYRPGGAGKFFLHTSSAAPFCTFAYRVKLFLAKPPKAKREVGGALKISVVGKSGPPVTMELASRKMMMHGDSYTLVGYHGLPHVSPVAKAQLSWHYHFEAEHPGTACVLCDDSLYVGKLVVASLPPAPLLNETAVALCSCDGARAAKIPSNSSHVFVPCFPQPASKWRKA